jgi:hypothetical protein
MINLSATLPLKTSSRVWVIIIFYLYVFISRLELIFPFLLKVKLISTISMKMICTILLCGLAAHLYCRSCEWGYFEVVVESSCMFNE